MPMAEFSIWGAQLVLKSATCACCGSTVTYPTATDGSSKRWVVVRPPGAETGLLLARADSEAQQEAVGNQAGGRVGFLLRVEDFDATYDRLVAAGTPIVGERRSEPYGEVCVFLDVSGNRWDLLGPPTRGAGQPT